MNANISLMETQEDEDVTLNYVHTQRKRVVEHLTKNGISSDPDEIKVLLSALKDMDSQAISRKRIKVEEKVNDLQAQSADLIAKVLAATTHHDGVHVEVLHRVLPMLPESIPKPILVDGETLEVCPQVTYSEFVSRYSVNDE